MEFVSPENSVVILMLLVSMVVSLRWCMVITTISLLLADSYLGPASTEYQYLRFLPLGVLAFRSVPAALRRRGGDEAIALPWAFLAPMGLLIFLSYASILYSNNPALTSLRSTTMAMVCLAFGVGLPVFTRDEGEFRRWIEAMALLLGAVISLGLPFLPRTTLEMGDFSRARGIFNNPNTYGVVAMLAFYPLFGLWRESTGRRRRLLGALTLLTLGGLLLSGSRAGLIGLIAGVTAFVPFRRVTVRMKFAVLSALLLGMGYVVHYRMISEDAAGSQSTTGFRTELWERAFEIGMESPLIGVGWGDVDALFEADKLYLRSIGIYYGAGGSHNEYIRLFVALGGIGVAVCLSGFAFIIAKSLPAIRRDPEPLLAICLLATMISGLVNAIFEDWLFAFGGAPATPFWFFLACLCIYIRRSEQKRSAEQRLRVQAAVGNPAFQAAPSAGGR